MKYAGMKTSHCVFCGREVFFSGLVELEADAVAYIAPMEGYPATETLYNIRGEPVPAVTGDAIPDMVETFPWGFRAHRSNCRRQQGAARAEAGTLSTVQMELSL